MNENTTRNVCKKTTRKTALILAVATCWLTSIIMVIRFVDKKVELASKMNHFPKEFSMTTSKTTTDPCDGYDGVLLIAHGDRAGAAGTIFFIFILNQLLYADKYNLLPWIHLNHWSKNVYDAQVHGTAPSRSFEMFGPVYPADHTSDGIFCPAKPNLTGTARKQTFHVDGTGVWTSYFQPVSSFDPARISSTFCANKPLVTMTMAHVIPGLHLHCRWSVRSWRYGALKKKIAQPEIPLHDWLGHSRRRAAAIIQKYYRLQPNLTEAIQRANPAQKCLAVHIRHSDKGNRRIRIPLQAFYPYIEAYVNHSDGEKQVYLATDSSTVVTQIRREWPAFVVNHIRTQGDSVVRSTNTTAVFHLSSNHHRTNNEVLVDILAMARCQFLIHGLSAVTEATIYWNLDLHNRSVNLEDVNHMSVERFRQLL